MTKVTNVKLHTSLFLLDSTSEVPSHAAGAVGSHGSLRYLSHFTPKVVTADEYIRSKINGVGLATVFEDTAAQALNGYDQGKHDAEFAMKQAQSRGMPSRRPIYFAVDTDPEVFSADRFDAYFDGCAAVMSRQLCGPYGGYKVVARQLDRGFEYCWQTYAWSAGRFDDRSTLYQYSNDHTVGGVGVDYDKAIYQDWGQWDFRTIPLDPWHYHWFDNVARPKMPYQRLTEPTEVAVVKLYDKYRAQQTKIRHPHRKELYILREQCAWLMTRVKEEAREPGKGGWNAFHRGWRFGQLFDRWKGQKKTH